MYISRDNSIIINLKVLLEKNLQKFYSNSKKKKKKKNRAPRLSRPLPFLPGLAAPPPRLPRGGGEGGHADRAGEPCPPHRAAPPLPSPRRPRPRRAPLPLPSGLVKPRAARRTHPPAASPVPPFSPLLLRLLLCSPG